jgi:hypothetical protein
MRILLLLLLASCAEVQHTHYRPTIGCYDMVCETNYYCSCWAPGMCFATTLACERNLKSSIIDVVDQMPVTRPEDFI